MIAVEKVGARVYILGDTFPIKDRLKDLGCHPEKGDDGKWKWWIGKAKAKPVEELVASANKGDVKPATVNLEDARVYAKVEYKGRTYYVIAESRDRTTCRLTTLDGMTPFWAAMPECNLLKEYKPRKQWDGRRGSNRTVDVYQTLGGLKQFRDEQKAAKKEGLPECAACGKRGSLVEDMEDGLMKCKSCCDMPSD